MGIYGYCFLNMNFSLIIFLAADLSFNILFIFSRWATLVLDSVFQGSFQKSAYIEEPL
jgi:hypothetical protein